jgi:endonuclease/exonuclease/phosphatase family metal-dependent hydrolase
MVVSVKKIHGIIMNRKIAYLSVFLCVLVSICCLQIITLSGESQAEQTSRIKVMSFNIRYGTANDGPNAWEHRKDLVFDVLRTEDPDLVGVQEALRFQLDEIQEALPHFNEFGVGRSDGIEAGEYSAILYREDRFIATEGETFWYSETPEEPGSADWGNTIPRICTWARFLDRNTNASLYFYNTHLDHRSQNSREKSAYLLSQRINDRLHPEPFVVTGDFNAGEDNTVIQFLKGSQGIRFADGPSPASVLTLKDPFREVTPNATGVGTFNDFEGRATGEKIDFVLVPAGIEILDAGIVRTNDSGRYPSDHYPVTATLVIQ